MKRECRFFLCSCVDKVSLTTATIILNGSRSTRDGKMVRILRILNIFCSQLEIKPLEPSPATLNFHYVDEDEMYAIHHALYHVRPIVRSSLLPSALHTDAFLRGALIDNDDKNYQSKFGG